MKGTVPALRPAAAVLAVGAILLAGCGGTSASTAAGGTSKYHKALAYAACIRSHGEPKWPDPASDGSFPGAMEAPGLTTGRTLITALGACQSLNPAPTMSKPQEQQVEQNMLKYSQCMRAHGVPNYPDPIVVGNGIPMERADPPGVDVNSPQYHTALRACANVP
jgi:hypothetical protein